MAYQPSGTTYGMQFPAGEAISFDPGAFDDAIHSQGVQLVHMRAMACPVGLVDSQDIRRPHEHHINCSNGFVYTLAGTFTGLFTGNSTNVQMIDPGIATGSSVQVVCPRYYDECECNPCQGECPMLPAPFDRIYLKEDAINVVHWEKFQVNANRRDRLQFPIVQVIDIMDSDGKRYSCGTDFVIEGGALHWTGAWPGLDAKLLTGKVVSCRYTYKPFWYVKQMLHEVRVTQGQDDFGERGIIRMPQSMLLQREYSFEKEQRDKTEASNPRSETGSPSGIFGPR